MDIRFNVKNNIFKCRVVALINKEDKILVEVKKNKKYYTLPGGKLKIGEKSKKAIIREIKEEIQEETIFVKNLGVVEHFYESDNKKYHEILFLIQLKFKNQNCYNKNIFLNKEDKDIKYIWKNIGEIKDSFLPTVLLNSFYK